MEFWIGSLRAELLNSASEALRKAKRRRITNMNEVVKLGFRLLQQQWDVVKCDKDGGFAVSPRGTLLKVHLEILQSETYRDQLV